MKPSLLNQAVACQAVTPLGGRISPLDRVKPEDLRIAPLVARMEKEAPSEIIFALAADVKEEATTNYLA